MRCPVCSAPDPRGVFTIEAAPVTCTSVYPTVAEALAVPVGTIRLAVCEACGFAFNDAFDPAIALLGANYESSQSASARFTQFADALAAEWIERHGLKGRGVIDVGCGSGEFLRSMLRAGVASAVGIDPLAAPRPEDLAGLEWRREEFGPQHFAIDADALVCRHTLEHVADVRAFLALVHAWAAQRPGRVVLFEVPASECVHTLGAFWDVYYEHCNYFTARTLDHAFALAGFTVLNADRVYDDQYLTLEARAADAAVEAPRGDPDEAGVWSAFGSAARASIARCRAAFETLGRDAGGTAIWQGAAKTVGVLSACGDLPSVACAIDLHPARQGFFLPHSAMSVREPAWLQQLAPSHVVLMNPVYEREVQRALDQLGVGARLHTVNDLLSGRLGKTDRDDESPINDPRRPASP